MDFSLLFLFSFFERRLRGPASGRCLAAFGEAPPRRVARHGLCLRLPELRPEQLFQAKAFHLQQILIDFFFLFVHCIFISFYFNISIYVYVFIFYALLERLSLCPFGRGPGEHRDARGAAELAHAADFAPERLPTAHDARRRRLALRALRHAEPPRGDAFGLGARPGAPPEPQDGSGLT